MDFDEIIMNILLVVCTFLLIIGIIAFLIFIPLGIKDSIATVKIKERIAENGIELTTTQINELVHKEVDND